MEATMTMPKLDARVRPFVDSSDRPTKLLAFAELTIADAFVIKGIRVLKREEGGEDPFVVFPAEKGKGSAGDRWFDVAHPVTAEARAAATALVLERWRQAGEGAQASARG
jgi:DNA-binding cell septation regulator SpoVG